MRNDRRRTAAIALGLALAMATGGNALAAGWELREFESPLGDKGVALTVPAKGRSDVRLGIACDGDTGSRWRGVAVVEEPNSKAGLGMNGNVRITFGALTARDVWSVRTTAAERRIFTAADSTRFARRLLSEEAKSPDAQVTIEINAVSGKAVPLTFPLAGLGAKIGELAKRCDDWDLKER